MNKFLAFVMAAVMMTVVAAAFADEAVPSIDTTSLTDIVALETENPGEGFTIELLEDSTAVKALVQDMFKHVSEGKSPASFLPEDVQAEIASDGVEPDNLAANEFIAVKASGYKEDMGAVTVYFKFSTPYHTGDYVTAVLACCSGGNVQWVKAPAQVVEFEGEECVAVTLTPAQATAMCNADEVGICVLSGK